MHASSVFALALWGLTALALPAPDAIDPVSGQLMPHFYDEIDLDEYEANVANNTGNLMSLAKRTQVKVCSYTTFEGSCHEIPGSLETYLCGLIAIRFKTMSNNNDCSHHTGDYAGLNWDLHATNKNPDKHDCTTTAQYVTINGALQNYFANTRRTVCGVKCLQLKHGSGTWRGYVSLAVDGYTASNYGCGAHSANVCYSGGKKDCKGNTCSRR